MSPAHTPPRPKVPAPGFSAEVMDPIEEPPTDPFEPLPTTPGSTIAFKSKFGGWVALTLKALRIGDDTVLAWFSTRPRDPAYPDSFVQNLDRDPRVFAVLEVGPEPEATPE